jgi:Fur family ferric uptake transcriptional regulator
MATARMTRQRDVILQAVRSTMDHPTADWVYRQARRRLPRISLGTVYRNLKRLTEEGLIREIQIAGQTTRFDANTGRHYHIRCLGCGRVNDLPVSVDRRLEEEAGRAMNYRVLGHQVEVLGLCPLCQSTGATVDNRYH